MVDTWAVASTRPLASRVGTISMASTGRAADSRKSSASRTASMGLGGALILQAGVGGDVGLHLGHIGVHHGETLRQRFDVFKAGRTFCVHTQGVEDGFVE